MTCRRMQELIFHLIIGISMWSLTGFNAHMCFFSIWIVGNFNLRARGFPLKLSGHQEVPSSLPHAPFHIILDVHFFPHIIH